MIYRVNDLVLYKYKLAIIQKTGDKLTIILEDKTERNVREKDIEFLVNSAKDFQTTAIEKENIQDVWQLLLDEEKKTATFSEILELISSKVSSENAIALWQIISQRTFFKYSGDVGTIEIVDNQTFINEEQKRQEKEAYAKNFTEFITILKLNQYDANYQKFYQEIAQFAFGMSKKSAALNELNIEQTPENAHELLLKIGFWDIFVNPYPQRYNLPLYSAENKIPEIADNERVDLTNLASFAIDDEGNQDPDDAIAFDGDIFWVHVADCSSLVSENSELDKIAQERISTQYLPERIVPMLPPIIIEKLGLGLQKISPAISFGIKVDENGNCSLIKLCLSKIKVQRISYEDAENKFPEFYKITEKFSEKRKQNGAIDLNLPEVKVSFDHENKKVTLKKFINYKSREMVANAMLMAGEAVAKFCWEKQIEIPFSTQENGENNSEKNTEQISDPARSFLLRKCYKKTQIKVTPDSHAGTGLSMYTRVTSPLRRYLDLVVHQQLRNFILAKKLLNKDEILFRIGLSESVSGQISASERNSNLHWKLVYLSQNLEKTFNAKVVDFYDGKYTFLIEDLAIDVKIKLPQDFELNAEVLLKVKSINLPRLIVNFSIV